MQVVRGSLVVLLVAAVFTGCPDDDADGSTTSAAAAPTPAVVLPQVPALPPRATDAPEDPVALVSSFLPGASGWCVQIRSVPTRLEADRVAAQIREELSLDVALIAADLGERGTWWRICVGHELTEAVADDAAKGWTGPEGALRKFMAEVVPGQAAYQLVEQRGKPAREPTAAMAASLARARPDDDRRPLVLSSKGRLFGAVTLPPDTLGVTDVAVVAEDGAVLGYPPSSPEGCEACRAALADVRPSRRLLSAGDVVAATGEELLIEERGGDDDAVLSVFAIDKGLLVRVAWFLLGTSTASLRVLGDARAVEANGEPGDELALTRVELPLVEDRLCTLRERVEILDLRRTPPRPLDAAWAHTMGVAEASGGAAPAKRLVAALDELGDPDAASRVCAAYLEAGTDPGLASLCIARVGELQQRGRVVAAVNAAGLLSEASGALRAAVAGPFYRAASALDDDPRLEVGTGDCEAAPLVGSVQGKRLEHLVKLARVRLKERVELADLAPEVFVTGARDFGPDAPVGELTRSWLERVKARLPAKHAALEAKVGAATALPPVAPPAPGAVEVSTGTRTPAPPTPPSSGYIHIEVHDDEPAGEDTP